MAATLILNPTDKWHVYSPSIKLFLIISMVSSAILTHREQEIPDFYKWWDELRTTRYFLD